MTEPTKAVFVISVAAELAGMHPQTLRIYERKGLVDPFRTPGRGNIAVARSRVFSAGAAQNAGRIWLVYRRSSTDMSYQPRELLRRKLAQVRSLMSGPPTCLR